MQNSTLPVKFNRQGGYNGVEMMVQRDGECRRTNRRAPTIERWGDAG